MCTISVSLTSGSANQTLTAGNAITTNQYTLSSTCSDTVTYSASASGLPTGVSFTITNNTASISGSPSTAGTYNYSLTVSGSTSSNASITSVVVSGTITVNAVVVDNNDSRALISNLKWTLYMCSAISRRYCCY